MTLSESTKPKERGSSVTGSNQIAATSLNERVRARLEEQLAVLMAKEDIRDVLHAWLSEDRGVG